MPFAIMADCWKYVYNLMLGLALLVAAVCVQLTFGSGEVLINIV